MLDRKSEVRLKSKVESLSVYTFRIFVITFSIGGGSFLIDFIKLMTESIRSSMSAAEFGSSSLGTSSGSSVIGSRR